MDAPRIAWFGLLAIASVWAALLVLGPWRWRKRTQCLHDRLLAGQVAHPTTRYHATELQGLPPVVQRFFKATLPEGTPIITAATLEQTGALNLGESADLWKAFTARQRVVTQRPGFVWDARLSMLPGLVVRVHDAYLQGQGWLQPSLFGLIPLANMHDTPAIAESELMRFLAEAAWFPTALLPSQGVRWTPVDDRSAKATLRDGHMSLTLTFGFNQQGLIESVRANARGRTEGRRIIMRPWEGRWSNHQERDGMQVPLSGEVAWLLPPESGGRKVYWRGTVTALRYEFAD